MASKWFKLLVKGDTTIAYGRRVSPDSNEILVGGTFITLPRWLALKIFIVQCEADQATLDNARARWWCGQEVKLC